MRTRIGSILDLLFCISAWIMVVVFARFYSFYS